MQSQQDEEPRSGIALYNSDTDDWTLVSPPPSEGSKSLETSPERKLANNENPTTAQDEPIETISAIPVKVDSCRADLAEDPVQSGFRVGASGRRDRAKNSESCIETSPKRRTSSLLVGSRKLALTSKSSSLQQMARTGAVRSERANDADDESDGMTEVHLDENGMASIPEQAANDEQVDSIGWTDETDKNSDESSKDSSDEWTDETECDSEHLFSSKPPKNISEFKELFANLNRRLRGCRQWERPDENTTITSRTSAGNNIEKENDTELSLSYLLVTAATIFLIGYGFFYWCYISEPAQNQNQTATHLFGDKFDFLYSDPSNHAYTELKLLNEEIADCIEGENPLTRELAHWRSMDARELHRYKIITNTRPFKGKVCYGNEVKWRKRFNFLKTEFNFDLRKITRQIKRRLTNDILVEYHPNTQFELILNQLEYLDHIEQRRKDRTLEKLKAENLELMRMLNGRSSSNQEKKFNNKSHYSKKKQGQEKNGRAQDQSSIKSLIILESENVRLRREVETLKSQLAEKAGTIYIKQSLELEKCERENNALRQFHQDVSDEINSNLIRVGSQQSADSLTHMTTNSNDDDEDNNLNGRLASTRRSLAKLSDEVTKLIGRNEHLKQELAETRALSDICEIQKNSIEDANRTKHSSCQKQEPTPRSRCQNNNLEPGSDLSRNQRKREEGKKDWQLKRAQLRQQLRDSNSVLNYQTLSDLNRVLRSVPQSVQSNSKQNHGKSTHPHKNGFVMKNRGLEPVDDGNCAQCGRWCCEDGFIRHASGCWCPGDCCARSMELKRLNSLKRLGSAKVNSYNENSHNNCRDHHRRDEL